MQALIRSLIRYRAIVLIIFFVMLAAGIFALTRLDIEAYPDPSPPLVEVITQNPSWSAEEMERQGTVPIETVLFGIPKLTHVRSISITTATIAGIARKFSTACNWPRCPETSRRSSRRNRPSEKSTDTVCTA